MKKGLLRMAAVVLVIVVTVSGLGIAVAQENAGVIQPEVLFPVLAVDVPEVVRVDEPVTITVTDRGNGTAVEGASVYALGWPRMRLSNANGLAWPQVNWFEFLGTTNGSGEVVHTFDRVGTFFIVATTEGYVPGLARLAVKPDLKGKLEIEAPKRAKVDQPVTIKVLDKKSGDAVPEADVWAISPPRSVSASAMTPSTDDVEALLENLEGMGSGDITGVLNKCGVHLGKTGDEGVLEYTFTEVGGYLLTATKSEYVPGLKPIAVVADKALAIHGLRIAGIDEYVTFAVTTRGTGTPVEGADIYALSMPSLIPMSLDLRDLEAEGFSLKEMVVGCGEHLGTTNEAGELEHQFSEAGIYLIVAVKDEYVPGVTGIVIIGQFEDFGGVLPQLKRFGERIGERLWE